MQRHVEVLAFDARGICSRRLAELRIDFLLSRRLKYVRLMRADRSRSDLLLRLLLLPLLLLLYRGPAQPDTTRATGQSTEGRGGQLLRLLLLTSSVSIPGELHMLPLLMLRSLLLMILGSSPGRLRTE